MEDVDQVKLARMLRECAVFVERNDFHTAMFQVLTDLSTYVAKHPNNTSSKGREVQRSNPLSAGISGITNAIGKIGLMEMEKGKASSTKNADRARADLQELQSGSGSGSLDSGGATADRSSFPVRPGKPAFQRPTNPESALIASGWIAQQRRSKLRVVWKDILATLVEARKPTEETTLWIQREIVSSVTGKRELEALHKIPIKWVEEVTYLDFYGDYRFSVKVYNISDEYVFRCADRGSAQDWVFTLRSVKEEYPRKQKDLRDAAAAAANTSANAVQADAAANTPSDVPAFAIPATIKDSPVNEHGVRDGTEQAVPRMTVKEMQAIAHGAGINTHGMERPDLERVVARILGKGSVANGFDPLDKVQVDAARRREEAERQEQMRRVAESEASAQAALAAAASALADAGVDDEKRRHLEEMQAQRVAEARRKASEEDEKRRQLEEAQAQRVAEARRKAAEEEEKRQASILEEQRRQAALAEERRVAEEQMKIAEEQRRLAAAAEEQRRRLAEQEHMRRQEEERIRAQQQYQQAQQQWQAQQAAQQQWQAQQAAAAAAHQRAQAAQAAQWQQWQQQQQQQQQQQKQSQQHQQNQQSFPQHPQRPSEPPTSSADMKYTKMAEESKGGEAVTINAVKRSILTHWALQPPNLQHLRSISDLLITIHSVFPPAFGVPGHDHFKKWTPITRQELIPVGAVPDVEKLNKAVKKLRFFLHPDKLPRDLNEEQQFMCRMLWDVSSDAWEEFKKRHEELDWMQK